jgi:hypothetical protein
LLCGEVVPTGFFLRYLSVLSRRGPLNKLHSKNPLIMAVMRQNVVLVVCLCLLFLQTATSFTSVYQKARYVKLSAAKSDVPTETVGGYVFADRVVNNVTLTTGGNSTGKPKRTVVSKNPRDWTPYVFRDADGEYDAPFINEAMW